MKKSSLIIFGSLIVLKILLEYSYISFVHPLFLYNGMTLNISYFKLFESYILFLPLVSMLIYLDKFKLTSKFMVFILFIVLYTPLSSTYWLQDNSRTFFYSVTASFIILIALLITTPKMKIVTIKGGKHLFNIIAMIITIGVYGFLIADGGLSRINFNLSKVYEFRELNSYSSNPIFAYLIPWQGYVINLSVMGIALYNKKFKQATLFLFLQLLLFAMTSHKSFLFAPFLLVGIYLLNKKSSRERYLLWFSYGASMLVALTMGFYKISDSIMLPSILIRRLFFIPANLNFIYYDFFQNREKFLLSHSVLEGITDTYSNITPVGLVSKVLYNQPSGANASFFADAYANFGVFGIVMFTVLLVLLFKIIDSITEGIPRYISISILLIPFMSLTNSAFFTSLLTHGILFSVFSLWLAKTVFTNYKQDSQKTVSDKYLGTCEVAEQSK